MESAQVPLTNSVQVRAELSALLRGIRDFLKDLTPTRHASKLQQDVDRSPLALAELP